MAAPDPIPAPAGAAAPATTGGGPPVVDLGAVLAAMQDQLDDLTATVAAQQRTLDELLALRGPRPAAGGS